MLIFTSLLNRWLIVRSTGKCRHIAFRKCEGSPGKMVTIWLNRWSHVASKFLYRNRILSNAKGRIKCQLPTIVFCTLEMAFLIKFNPPRKFQLPVCFSINKSFYSIHYSETRTHWQCSSFIGYYPPSHAREAGGVVHGVKGDWHDYPPSKIPLLGYQCRRYLPLCGWWRHNQPYRLLYIPWHPHHER